MSARFLHRAISISALVPLVLSAQAVREHAAIPVTHWAAPLYWQAAPAPQLTITTPPVTTNLLVFVAMTPCRLVDTRQGMGFTGAFGPPSLVGGQIRTFPIQTSTTCAVSSSAQAYSFNVTAVAQGPLTYLTVYPAVSGTQPLPPNVSTLNSLSGAIVANAAIVPAGTDGYGSVDVYATNNTDLLIDINGYYVAPGAVGGNLALGTQALVSNTNGDENTAVGDSALHSNSSGVANTAAGYAALQSNTTGSGNTASGFQTLSQNTTGLNNTAAGSFSLNSNTTGSGNSAFGDGAMGANSIGSYNTAVGLSALGNNFSGNNNIAIGFEAAFNAANSASNNIHIGNPGLPADNGTIRIGSGGTQTSFFAAGVRGVTTGNNDAEVVMIDSNGQLGTISSSARFKEEIRDMGDASARLLSLRPVTFRYRQPFADGSKPLQYGLIAEEVARLFPDLVAHSADGRIESVKYQLLDPLLLNEVQKLERRVAELERLMAEQHLPPAP